MALSTETRSNGLTAKQKLFCEEYVANGYQAVAAYQKAYPTATYETANANQWRLMKKPAIKDYIKQLQHDRFEALNINADKIVTELNKIAFADYDEYNNNNSKLKALELLGKTMSLYTDKVDVDSKQTIEINITEDEDA